MDIFEMLIHVGTHRVSLSLQFTIYLGLFLLKKHEFEVLPPDLVPNRDLMTPRIPGMDIFVLVIHVWYTRSTCLSVFLQFAIFMGLFLLKNRKFDVFTPGFGPKGELNDP